VPIGRTPLTLPVLSPGAYSWELRKEAHRSKSVSGTVEAGSTLNFTATLPYDPAPVTSRSFRNGLGQDMVWIGELNGWAAAHETTQAQFERLAGENPSYFKAPNHPVDSVTWYKAVKFCEALTVQEQGLGNLPAGYRYRLPTDAEWTKLVGGQKLDGAISSLFDRKSSTAPVGSLTPNLFGLYDVRGNVWEWVSDWYSQRTVTKVRQEGATPRPEWVGTDRKVLRGGAWNRSSQFDLAIANRMAARPSAEDRYDVGFRVVLMPE
jgi:formylglycine-generating enzyme required for sulfatase activity